MIPEIGHFALILSLCLAVTQTVVPAAGVLWRRQTWMAAAKTTAVIQFVFLTIAFACLTATFVNDDFSVAYVASNSNTAMPLLYKVSGVWGAHEGSLLLWVLMLAVWQAAVALFSRQMPPAMTARVLSVLGGISVGFLSFLLFTSNPFARLSPSPLQGSELNPLLQDPGLAFHPPMLYMGYVGFSVAFAFTIAALLAGKMDSAWARWTRPWTNAAWLFLTLGIALGSWWAYYELGWGGWWFWDPVENVSFMPWLAGTALLHSLAATEARGVFRKWTALMALLTFSLSLLGAFIVRSGLLTSVHAFANDPVRGLYLLVILALVTGGGLLLFSWRANALRPATASRLVSRESGILLNNLFLNTALFAVLIGTLYPLFLDAINGEKISVGVPYFNAVFVPLAAPLAAVAGLGAYARWKKDTATRLLQRLSPVAVFAVIAGAALPLLMPHYDIRAAAGLTLAIWTAAVSLRHLADYVFTAQGKIARPPLSFLGMIVAHLGLAVFVAGATQASVYGQEKNVQMAVGEAVTMSGYRFEFFPVRQAQVENYQAQIGDIRVSQDGREIAVLHPEKRLYASQPQPLTEAGIEDGVWRDLYVALGEPLENDAWSVRLQIKPLVRWVWGGAALMALGAALAAAGRWRR